MFAIDPSLYSASGSPSIFLKMLAVPRPKPVMDALGDPRAIKFVVKGKKVEVAPAEVLAET
jgi:hypothetical protein